MHRRNSGFPTIHLISAVFVDSPLKLIGAMISIEGEYNLRPVATLKIISGAHRPYFEHEIVVLGNKISRITYFEWLRGFFPEFFRLHVSNGEQNEYREHHRFVLNYAANFPFRGSSLTGE